jgi:hypothetical protein
VNRNTFFVTLIFDKGGDGMSIIAQPKEDFTGVKFGRLTVQCRADDYVFPNGKGRAAKWHCLCDCGNEVDVRHDKLKDGITKSCGCLAREISSILIKTAIESCKKPLKNNKTLQLNLHEEGYEPFGKFRCDNDNSVEVYFSMKDYDSIKEYCWFIQRAHNGKYCRVQTIYNNSTVAMHRLFNMYDADHINRNALDNRRENLDEMATRSDQSHNQNLRKDNKTGVRGLLYNSRYTNRPWRVQCKHNGELVLCDGFASKDEAILAILQTEMKYYPERSWQKELMIQYNLI